VNLQFGLPGEASSSDEVETNIRTMARLGRVAALRGKSITVYPQLFVVYPGTRHFGRYLAMRLFPEDVFETFTAWESKNKPIRTWLGETFAHGTGGIPLGILNQHSLWNRRYEIDEDAVARVSKAINDIDSLDGVNVFRYGQYLVREKTDAGGDDAANSRILSKSAAPAQPRLVASDRRRVAGAA
jgi:hypothetical protein